MKKHIIEKEELVKFPYGLLDSVTVYRLKKHGFDLKRRIFGYTDIKTKQTIYTQNCLLVDTTITALNFVSKMLVKGILK